LAAYYGKREYDKWLLNKRALEHTKDLQANALRIEDELQESHEYYDQQFDRVSRHHRDTISLLRDAVLSPIEDAHLRDKLDVLSLLQDHPSRSGDPLSVDFRQVIDELIARKLILASVPVETITVINAVPEQSISGRTAGPLALAASELLENALIHAFEPTSQANFIEVELSMTGERGTTAYRLTLRDDGTGIPENLVISEATPGLALIHRLAAACDGSFELDVDLGTTAIFEIPVSESD
jgi:two-component sensor histidine kinase